MAWNQPGKGGQTPWRGKPNGGGMDAFTSDCARVRGRRRHRPAGLAGRCSPCWCCSTASSSWTNSQRGVVLRFGEFDRNHGPGANFKWPWPAETVTIVDANKIEYLEDPVRVLTQDENIVDIKFNAQYLISDPRLFLFGFRDDLRSRTACTRVGKR